MLTFHPLIRADLADALRHYDQISRQLGDDFWTEFQESCLRIEANPKHFHFDPSGWRRLNLPRFPYHVLFQVELNSVRLMTLRHHERNPQFGLRRR